MKLELTTLQQRRNRRDLIQIYKIKNYLEEVHLTKYLSFAVSGHFTRGNFKNLRRELVKSCTHRFNFLNNRVVKNWSALPDKIVKARSLNSFKGKIYGFMKGSC